MKSKHGWGISLFVLLLAIPLFSVSALAGSVENRLQDKQYLEDNGYLIDGDRVQVIVELKDSYSLQDGKDAVFSELNEKQFDFTKRHDLNIINSFSLTLPFSAIDTISSLPPVDKVWLNGRVQGDLQNSVPLINADDVWNFNANTSEGNNLPIKGDGVTVSIIDSGIAYNHSDIGESRILYQWDYVNNDTDTYPYDGNEHGTHVAGILGANGGLKGVSPGISFFSYKVLDGNGTGNLETTVLAVEDSVERNSTIISMSLGYPCDSGCNNGTDLLSQAVDNAVEDGVSVVTSVGNDGPDAEIKSPESSRKVISVGATNDDDKITDFSSRGPTADNRTKPDIVAPGSNIKSTIIQTELLKYGTLSGTSMSAPHISGVVALMKQAYPNWNPGEIKSKLKNSTVIYTGKEDEDTNGRDPDSTYGWGRVDALRALDNGNAVTEEIRSSQPNENGWYNIDSISIDLRASDAPDAIGINTGVRELYYEIEGGESDSVVTLNGADGDYLNLSTTFTEEGVHTLNYYSVDNGGNVESTKTSTIRIDRTAPNTAVDPTGNNGNTTITLDATDENSGVNRTVYRINDGNDQIYEGPFDIGPGDSVTFYSVDNADNSEEETTISAPSVDITSPKNNRVYFGSTEVGEIALGGEKPPLVAGDVVVEFDANSTGIDITNMTFEVYKNGLGSSNPETDGERVHFDYDDQNTNNGKHEFVWSPEIGERGYYTVKISVSNEIGVTTDDKVVFLLVGSKLPSTETELVNETNYSEIDVETNLPETELIEDDDLI